jgi:serine phosphatase RsbU (regulator of sigma subunit)
MNLQTTRPERQKNKGLPQRTIVFITLLAVILVITLGIFVTLRVSRNLVTERLSPQLSLWAPTQQEREILLLRDVIRRIALGIPVDEDDYFTQRDQVINSIALSNQTVLNAETSDDPFFREYYQREKPYVVQLQTDLQRYLVIEQGTFPTSNTALRLQPVVDRMITLSHAMVNSRRVATEAFTTRVVEAARKLQYVQVGTLMVLLVAGGLLIWLTNKTLTNTLAIERARAEEAEYLAQKLELVNHIALSLSSQLDQQEILDMATREVARLFWADHVGIMFFDESSEYDTVGTVVAEYPSQNTVGMQVELDNSPIMQQFFKTGRPICISSTATDEISVSSREHFQQLGVASFMAFPLISHNQIIGSIGLDCYQERQFTQQEEELLLSVSTSIAAAVQNSRLFAAEHNARKTADTLREVARVISSSFDPDEVLQLILGELENVIYYDSASIMLREGNHLTLAASRISTDGQHSSKNEMDPNTRELHLKDIEQTTVAIEERRGAAQVIQNHQPVLINDTSQATGWSDTPLTIHIRSWLGVPLIARDATIGVLNINAHEPHRFTSRDAEVAMTFANQSAVALENARLYKESIARFEQELSIAHQIQNNLFPRSLPEIPGLTVAASCVAARETGGDFFDVFALNDQRLALMIGDASGKSIPGAMLMLIARAAARTEARDQRTPYAVTRATNRSVFRDVPPHSFVAFCYATIDADHMRLAFANAGQLSPLHRTADGTVHYLNVPGAKFPLGILPETPYDELQVELAAGDMLLFYTDGVVEAHNTTQELFGFERLEELVRESGCLPPAEFIAHIMQQVKTFAGETAQHDDITLVAVRVEGACEERG